MTDPGRSDRTTPGGANKRRATAKGPSAVDRLRQDVKHGRESQQHGETVPAPVVRSLVLGSGAPSGVRIRGARIAGTIDLRDARGPAGEPCNALILTDCELVGTTATSPGLDASHASIRRLSLSDCRADGIELSSAVIGGDLGIDGLRGREDPAATGACWVKARNIQVGGALTAARAKLGVPWTAERPWDPADDPLWAGLRTRFGLDLRNARIGSWLMLEPDFESNGGTNLSSAVIGGDVWARGARLVAPVLGENTTNAVVGQSLEVRRHVALGMGLDAHGSVDLYGAAIGGTLDLRGAVIETIGATGPAVDLYASKIGADLLVGPAIDDPSGETQSDVSSLELTGATIDGRAWLMGWSRGPIQAIDARGLRVRGDLEVKGTVGRIDLSAATVDGRLVLDEVALVSLNGDAPSLSLEDAHVGQDLRVRSLSAAAVIALDRAAIIGARSAGLPFYPGWSLLEVLIRPMPDRGIGVLSFLLAEPDAVSSEGQVEIRILDGASSVIHDRNDETAPLLGSEDLATAYLEFFCYAVWGDEGPFSLTPGSIRIAPAVNGAWAAHAEVTYGSATFAAELLIGPTGSVEMLDDEPLRTATAAGRLAFAPPIRWYEVTGDGQSAGWPPDHLSVSFAAWEPETRETVLRSVVGELGKAWVGRAMTPTWPTGWSRPMVDLAGLQVAAIDDDSGAGWFAGDAPAAGEPWEPVVQLRLVGFEYGRLGPGPPPTPKAPATRAEFGASEGRRRDPAGSIAARIAGALARLRAGISALRGQADQAKPVAERQRAHEWRRRWLTAQYPTSAMPTEEAYQPQPYEQLARTWRNEGHYIRADAITIEKLQTERQVYDRRIVGHPVMRVLLAGLALLATVGLVLSHVVPDLPPTLRSDTVRSVLLVGAVGGTVALLRTRVLMWPVEKLFGYGLRTDAALKSCVALWAIGWALAWLGTSGIAPATNVLKVDTAAVSTTLTEDGRLVVVPTAPSGSEAAEVDCRNQIDPALYALDVMVPLLDLRQEQRCTVSSQDGYWFWRMMKVAYAVGGWIVVSGLVLTASGVVRRQVEK